jgi:hypothetical protein
MNEIHPDGYPERSEEIGHEKDGPLEHAHDEQVFLGILRRYAGSELMDLSLNLFGCEQRFAEIDAYHEIPPE